jgi:succinate dehydrogenase / fumarate reductase, membrane anchor subunit
MVGNVMSFSNNGLKDWIWQRVTAVILAVYTIYLFVFFLSHPNLDYAQWQLLFSCTIMRIATVLVLFSVLVHAWIGMWTVLTDYVKPTAVRLSLQILILLALLSYLIWGIAIVWGA